MADDLSARLNGEHEDEDAADNSASSDYRLMEGRPSNLEPCNICGRTFLPESLARHSPICERNAAKGNRRVFNMAEQRLSELDISQISTSATQIKRGKENSPVNANQEKPSWKIQHDELRQNIRNAREITKAMKEGKPPPASSKPSGPPLGYVQCQFCGRHFNKTAAERHIEFCREQKNRLIQPQVDNHALERLMARTKYKAPKLKAPGTPARQISSGLKTPTATPGIVSNQQQQCQSAGSSPVTLRKTREDSKGSSVRRRHHTLSPLTASRRSELTPRYFDDDSDDDELVSEKSWGGLRTPDKGQHSDSSSRLVKISTEKGQESELAPRRKSSNEAESSTAAESGRPNRKSYPSTAKSQLRRKRSSSRIAGSTRSSSAAKPYRDVSPAGSASSINSGCGTFSPAAASKKPQSVPPPLPQLGDSDVPLTSGPESPPVINRSQSFPDKQLLRRYHPSLQQPTGAPDAAASGCESTASAVASGEHRSWSANAAGSRGRVGGLSPRPPSMRSAQVGTKAQGDNVNAVRAGKTLPGIVRTNELRRLRIAKQKETRFGQRVGAGDFDPRMTTSMPPGTDLDLEYKANGDNYSNAIDEGLRIVPIEGTMCASTYYPQGEGQLKLPPLPPSSSDGDLGYLSNNSDGGIGSSHKQGHMYGDGGGGEAILAKFCHSCGTRFPISWARFCCMCGEKRLWMNPADKLPQI